MKSHHRWYSPWLYLAPALLALAVFNLWPSINTILLSFTNTKPLGGGSWVGTHNYEAILRDDQVVNALLNSLLYTVVCLPLLTFLPLLIAVLVEKKIPGIGFFRTAYYTPVIASAVVVGIIWQWLLQENGLVNGLAQHMGIIQDAIPFLTDRWLVVFSAISLTVWKGLGYYMIIYLAALANVPKELYEAAAVDGAGPIRRFFTVTVPGVRRTMYLIATLITISALRIFAELFILAGPTGGPGGQSMSVVMLIQQYARGFTGDLGYATALSMMLFLLTLVPLLVIARLNSRGGED